MSLTKLRIQPVPAVNQVLLAALAFASALALQAGMAWNGVMPDSDDLMRLQQVRDLLSGQSWFDVHQSRFVTPEGGAMHWSRLPDLFIGGLILVLAPLLGEAGAEHAALIVWPALLLGMALAGIITALHRLGVGRFGMFAGAIAFILSQSMVQFQAGRIDHHGLQLVLVIWAFASLAARGAGLKSGLLAGFLVAAMMSVAIEAMPMAAGLSVMAGMLWIVRGAQAQNLLAGFGAALAGCAIVLYLFDAPGAGAGRAVCDAYGNFHAVGLIAGGLGMLALALMTARICDARSRLLAASAIAGVSLVGAILLAPGCLASPYAGVSENVITNWMSSITEARSLPRLIETSPGFAVAVFGFAITGIACAAAALRRGEADTRTPLAGLLGLLLLATLVTAWQVRGVVFAHGLSAIAVGWCAGWLWPVLRDQQGPARILALAALIGMAPSSWQALGQRLAPKPAESRAEAALARAACRSDVELSRLAALPAGGVFAPIDLGAAILEATPHRVFAAPYHRNVQAIEAALEVFQSDPEIARERLNEIGADYLYVCSGLGELRMHARRAPAGLAARLVASDPPGWLQPAGPQAEADAQAVIYIIGRDQVAGRDLETP